MANKKKKDPYSPETIRRKRKFPVSNTVGLVFCLIVQAVLVLVAIFFQPTPQDRIDEYNVTVTPLSDGSLDITYDIPWTALDEDEPLTWVEIGMANESFTVYKDSLSKNIRMAEAYIDDGYCSTRIHFTDEYWGGDTLRFSFKVNQKKMMSYYDSDQVIFEFVPGWFNETPIESYTFKWWLGDGDSSNNAHYEQDGWGVWSGSLKCGGYETIRVFYLNDTFSGSYVPYKPFDGQGAHDGMRSQKISVTFMCGLIAIIPIIFEVMIIDSYVSYGRGRGFLRGYGYHMHVYGRVNPLYRTASNSYGSTGGHHYSHGRGGSSGCACACACACAGGGRAGCSQKDTYGKRHFRRAAKDERS